MSSRRDFLKLLGITLAATQVSGLLPDRGSDEVLDVLQKPSPYPQPVVPVGSIFPFVGTDIPEGWVLCDGRSLAVKDYPELFTLLEPTQGHNGSNWQEGSLDFSIFNLLSETLMPGNIKLRHILKTS